MNGQHGRNVGRQRRIAVGALALLALLLGGAARLRGQGSRAAPLPPAPLAASVGAQATAMPPPLPSMLPPSPTPLPSPSAPPPAALRLAGVPNHKQERALNCEFRSAADLAAYYGWPIAWDALFEVVGHDPNGDPNEGFVGRSMDDPSGSLPPLGYGVHAGPVARGLRRLAISATAHQGQSVGWLKEKLAAGHPVVVWARAGMMGGQPISWQTADGRTVQGVSYEHTFTVIGYDEGGVWVNDPFTAQSDYYPWPQFEASWAVLGHMALTIDENVPGTD